MSTTNLFVELLVIGVGCAGWVVLLTGAALGYNSALVGRLLATPAAALPALAAIYLLGIVVDRVADSSLHFLRAERRARKYFASEHDSIMQRGYVLTNSRYFATQFDYSRSRQRICRGWILNGILLAVSANVLLIARPELIEHPARMAAFATLSFIVLAGGCWFSWEKLVDTELKRIRDQARWLRDQKPNSASFGTSSS